MTQIKLIPHDGGPCPVDRNVKRCIVIDRVGGETIIDPHWEVHERDWNWKGREFFTDILSYCQIEIKEQR